jgi:epoxyqueuosine reductase QueG
MTPKIIQEILDKHLIPKQDYIYGFADLQNIIDDQFNDYQYGISIGKRLTDRIVDKVRHGPTLEYYNHYRKMNEELTSLAEKISKALHAVGIETLCIEPTVTTQMLDTVYSKDLTTRLSHKMVATRAGLGWIGKSDLFVSKAFGPRLRLVSLLTNIPLNNDIQPIEKSRCGTCSVCVQKCPAQAINGKMWDITVHRDEFFDPFKCRQKCKEFGEMFLQMDVRVCGICVSVCPIGV